MSATVLGVLMILIIIIFGIIPFVLPTFLEYHRIYKQIQDAFGLSDWDCIRESIKDAVSDVFTFKSNDNEVDD